MTGGQITLSLDVSHASDRERPGGISVDGSREITVRRATDAEQERHQARLVQIDKASGGECLWLQGTRTEH